MFMTLRTKFYCALPQKLIIYSTSNNEYLFNIALTARVVALGPRAVHEVLLGQRREHAGFHEESAFRGAGRPK